MRTQRNDMTRHLFLIPMAAFVLFLSGLSLNAQPSPEANPSKNVDKVEALRTAYIISQAQLTQEEVEDFLPLYEQYREEVKAAFGKPDAADDHIKRLEAKLAIEKRYHTTFLQMLGEEKLNAVYLADQRFKWQLLKYLQRQKADK